MSVRDAGFVGAVLMGAVAAWFGGLGCDTSSPASEVPPYLAPPPSTCVEPRVLGTASGFRVDEAVPSIRLPGLAGDDSEHDHDLAALATDPCAPPQLLLMRLQAGLWCGPCLWHADHTQELMKALPSRVTLVDVLQTDEVNHRASTASLRTWRARAGGAHFVLRDPDFVTHQALPVEGAAPPLYLIIDRRNMRVLRSLSNPDVATVRTQVEEVEASLEQRSPRTTPPAEIIDGFFRPHEWDLLRGMALPEGGAAPPADPTNAVADDPRARALGESLFFDAGLSPSGTISCASCHDPKKAWSDDLPRAVGVAQGTRRSPSIALASHAPSQFWDGRVDTLWAQALAPFEDPREFASSRVFVVRQVAARYRAAYEALFPDAPLPRVDDLPSEGRPGDPRFDALDATLRAAVTRVFVNVGKSIAAFERSLRVAPNRLDRYIGGDTQALSRLEKEGLSIFLQAGCVSCHWGPRLTDDAFHNVAFAHGATADAGRAEGLALLSRAEFRADSRWSDAPSAARPVPPVEASDLGAFRTPTLRGVAHYKHFGHAGTIGSILDVTAVYGSRGASTGQASFGSREPWLLEFGFVPQWSITPLLEVLTADVVNAPSRLP
jgi:cytochrome c peroxidase